VYCQLEALRHCLPPSVERILEELPKMLDETYGRVLREINKANREHARRLLQCLTVALRPLRVEELAEILAIDFNAPSRGIPQLNPNWHWADQHQAVLSTCSSLIAIVDDGDSKVVQFSHFSIKEYLTSDWLALSSADVSRYHIVLEPAHIILAQACLGVLLRLDDHVNQDNIGTIPLAKYAAQYWVDHAGFEKVAAQIQDAMEYFFDADKSHWAAWCRVQMIDKRWQRFNYDNEVEDASPLYYASLGGFYDLVEHLVGKHTEHINARGGRMLTPLVAALGKNHFDVAEILHRNGADVDVHDSCCGATPLRQASWAGVLDIMEWLLNHEADVNAQDHSGYNLLQTAADNGQIQAFQMLLEHNADIHIQNAFGETALHVAAAGKVHIDIMQVLLDHGANPNSRDNKNSTPLHLGTVEGSTRLLLQHGAIIEAEDNMGKTPLQLALENRREEIATCLKEHGATR
jgi:ankyrin repeat protein